MRHDVSTVAWKEWRELTGQPGAVSGRGGYQLDLIMVLLTAIGLYDAPSNVLVAGFVIPGFFSGFIFRGPFSFAGERDHRTLAPVLATRIPGEALFLGKALFSIVYGWCLGTAFLMVAAGWTVLWRGAPEAVQMVSSTAPIAAIIGVPAVALFSQFGLILSMRSATAIQASQRAGFALAAVILTPIILVGLVLLTASRMRGRHWGAELESLVDYFLSVGPNTWIVVGVVALASLNALALLTGLAWSSRSRLTIE